MYHIIYNPNSGMRKTKKAAEVVRSLLAEAGHETHFHPTEGAGHCTEIVRIINMEEQDDTAGDTLASSRPLLPHEMVFVTATW